MPLKSTICFFYVQLFFALFTVYVAKLCRYVIGLSSIAMHWNIYVQKNRSFLYVFLCTLLRIGQYSESES